MGDPLKPSVGLLVKLGSIAVHVDEMMGPGGHDYDRYALRSLLEDTEVTEWIAQMTRMAMMPVKR